MAEHLKSKAHVLALYRAAKEVGVDPATLSAENPFTKSGATAAIIQGVIQENDAVLAAEMRQAAGITPNLAAVAQMMSGGEIDDVARQSLFECDAKYAAEVLAQQKEEAKQMDAKYEQGFEQLRMNRFMQQAGGNEARAKHLMQQEDAIHARQQQEMQQMGVTFGRSN